MQELRATYADMTAARTAIDALQYGGVDPADIQLLGAAADAARRADEQRNSAARDLPLVRRVLWRGVWWSIVGAPVGALLGGALALVGLQIINWWFTVLLWALFGHLLGGMIGAYAALGIGTAWEMTFQDVEGMPVVLAVRATTPDAAARADRLLRATQPRGIDAGATGAEAR
jgi:hypothetical protein